MPLEVNIDVFLMALDKLFFVVFFCFVLLGFFFFVVVFFFQSKNIDIFSYFFTKNICCGYSLEVPHRGTSNECPQHMFSWRNKKNIYLIPTLILTYVFYYFEIVD